MSDARAAAMDAVKIVPVYAALLALLFVALSVRTLRLRRRLGIAVGDGGDETLLRASRVHANFAEYVPLALVLLAFVEAAGTPAAVVHALGVALLAGRTAHAWGVRRVDERFAWRVSGMALTLGTIGTAAAVLLAAAARAAIRG